MKTDKTLEEKIKEIDAKMPGFSEMVKSSRTICPDKSCEHIEGSGVLDVEYTETGNHHVAVALQEYYLYGKRETHIGRFNGIYYCQKDKTDINFKRTETVTIDNWVCPEEEMYHRLLQYEYIYLKILTSSGDESTKIAYIKWLNENGIEGYKQTCILEDDYSMSNK